MDHQGVHEVWLCHQLAFRATDTPEKKKHPSKIMSRVLPMCADLEPQICEDLIVDLRRLLVQSIRESPTDPSSVRVTVGNDGSAPARYSDEVFVHARMLSGHHRRGLTPADDDGSHSRIQ